ncbi:beta-N-acetylhexosaminidase [Mycoplasmatota bacterium]|nr:beta-N-acetylhexosaminidase [Mycoplasmatota bacterium]
MKRIEEMTLREKIGQLLMIGFQEDDFDGIMEMIEKYKVGNIILFTRNVKDANRLMRQNQALQKKALETLGVPLFISIDQEGGMVTRIMQDATFFPGNMTLGATENDNNAYHIGQMMGEEMKTLGVNLNLAPVLDVNNNVKNPVIGVRSYSDNPEVVAKFGTQFIKGLQENGVLATGKHFPGHGDTSVDSHLDLTKVSHDKKRLNEVELVPFKQAIKSGINAIMSAHVLFPSYEDEFLPATLSRKVLTNLLRNELGFKGLIVTDCMEMKAIDNYFTTEKAVVKAVGAGANLVCISHTRNRQIGAIEELVKAVEEKRLDEAIIDQAVQRVLAHKEKIANDTLDLINRSTVSLNIKDHNQFAQHMNDIALTLVSGKRFIQKGKVLFVAPNPVATTIADDSLDQQSLLEKVKKSFTDWNTIELKIKPSKENQDAILKAVTEVDQVVFCSYNAHIYKTQYELIKQIKEKTKNIHLIALRNPYDVMDFSDIDCICAYEYTPHSIQSILKYLKSEIEPVGSIPVEI